MPSCAYCGAPRAHSAAASCPDCGMPYESGAPGATGRPLGPAGTGYVRVGPTVLPLWLLWLVAALLVVGGGTAWALLASSSEPSPTTAGGVPSADPFPGADTGTAPPADGVPPTYGGLPTTSDPLPSPDFPSPDVPSPSPDDASVIVTEYYRDINDHDFTAAWDLGGKNIAGTSYAEWLAGFRTTENIELSAVNTESSGEVGAVLRALQSDGSVKLYQGTYTVSDGVIVSAHISER
ncbi:hypothetical protein AB0C96_03190 [Streptomyces sp. NPDC048506]|uniref:hypothetical protein n=1 Tax=Streptomyces sp. NPDC048506 TaxID=3155028 RepID=UPI00341BFE76